MGAAVSAAANFEKGLSDIKAVSGATEEEMEALRQKALQIGRDTSLSARLAADAMFELSKAGLETDDILNGAADAAVALAEAGGIELAEAASIASAAMNQFQLDASELPGVADLLAGAANKSATDVRELGLALNYAGPLANAAGLSIEDTTTAIAAMAKSGITGSKAGTAMRAMLTRLQPASAEAATSMQELGLITEDGSNAFYDAEGNLKSFDKVAGLLQGSLQGLTKEQQQAYLTSIFGQEAISGVLAIAGQGEEGFSDLAASIGEVSAADVASERLNNLQGSITILKGTIETFLIGAGTPLQSMLRGVVDGITGFINSLAQLDPKMTSMIVIGTAIAGVLSVVLGGVLLLASALPAMTAGFAIFTSTILPIIGIVVGIIAVLAALALGLRYLWQNSETFRNIVMAVWAAVQQAAQAVVAWFMTEALPFLQETWAQIQVVFQTASEAIVAIITWFVGVVQGFWDRFGTHIVAAAKNFLGFLLEFFRATWENIKQVIDAVLRVIKGIFDVFAGIFTGDWNRVWEGIKAIFSGIWSAIHAVFSQIVATIIGVAKTAWTTLETIIGAAMAAISQVWSGTWNAIKTFLSNIIDHIKSAISGGFDSFKEAAEGFYNKVLDIGEDVIMFFAELPHKIISALGNVGTMLLDAGKNIVKGLVDGIKEMASAPIDAVKGIAGGIRDALPFSPAKIGPLKDNPPDEAGRTIATMIADGLLAGMDEVNKAGFMLAAETIQQPTGTITPAVQVSMPDRRSEASRGGTFAPAIHNNIPGPTADDLTRASERALRSAALKWGVQP